MVKVVFFDVDGTLVSHKQKAVSESARMALDKLAQKGILRVLATGRHMGELAQLPIHDISFDGYVTLTGQLTLDAAGNVIAGSPITGADKQVLIRLFNEKRIPLSLVEKDRMYINFVDAYTEAAQRAISSPVPELGEYTGEEIYQAVAYLDRAGERELMERLPGCKASRWDNYGIDIYSAAGGKTIGIREFLKAKQIAAEETMAFGDGENDMDMLRYVQTGVAMGNADDSLKEIADYITESVDEDGIWKALTALRLID